MNLFSEELFPTPRAIGRKMVAKIKGDVNGDVKYWLEPSAGKGDLAAVIREPVTFEEFEEEMHPDEPGKRRRHRPHYWTDHHGRGHIDVIEIQPDLVHVLRAKNYDVVGHDWLEYNGTSYYDAIVMNPPFSRGAAHLLKAWDFLHNGEIVCLLNEETLLSPHTEERRRLLAIIESNFGEIDWLGPCFDDAERKTDVRVAMVYLKKVATDDSADMWASEVTQEKADGVNLSEATPNMPALRDKLGNMEHWYNMANTHWMEGIAHLRKARLYMNQNKVSDYANGNRDADFKTIAGMAIDNVFTSRAEFLRRHRRLAWTSVFQQMEFHKWLDSKQQERFMRDIERDSSVPFTADNIKSTLENVFLQRKKLFDESVARVFDELTSHHAGNTNTASEGWKTNDSYKVNERLVFPRGCHYDPTFGGRFDIQTHYTSAATLYDDIDRILCVLDAKPYEQLMKKNAYGWIGGTVGKALHDHFERIGRVQGQPFDGTFESQYFTGRFFKKGTVHLKWKRLDLLEAFNRTAAAGKRWIGENTQAQRPTKREEHDYPWDCRKPEGGHNFVDGKCSRCEEPEIDPLPLIQCELCRAVFEATGEQHCPLHPLPAPEIAAPVTKLLTAAEAEEDSSYEHDPFTDPHGCFDCDCNPCICEAIVKERTNDSDCESKQFLLF